MITFGYVRVSTKDQNLERQYTSIKSFRPDIPDSNIFCDKQTGKNFDRDEYQKMKVIMEHTKKETMVHINKVIEKDYIVLLLKK